MIELVGAPAGQVAVADGAWRFEVNEGGDRRESGLWDVVLLVTATNETGPKWKNDAVSYEVVIDGVEYAPSCFTEVAGNNPSSLGSSTDVLVGFEVTRDPGASNRLALDLGGPMHRIELTPSTAG